jgi:hypothetical protein
LTPHPKTRRFQPENDETRKYFDLCELYGAQHWRAGVNKNPANSLGEKVLAPRHGFEPRLKDLIQDQQVTDSANSAFA